MNSGLFLNGLKITYVSTSISTTDWILFSEPKNKTIIKLYKARIRRKLHKSKIEEDPNLGSTSKQIPWRLLDLIICRYNMNME